MERATSSASWLSGLLVTALALPAAADPLDLNQWLERGRPLDRPSASPSTGSALFAAPTRLDQIGRIVVPVMIDGKGPFRFVLDTGASHSTISPRTAAALGLAPEADALVEVNGITGSDQMPAVPIKRLQVGDLVIENTSAPVVRAPMLADSDGILGAAGLTRERILVDFQHDRVAISSAHGAGAVAGFVRIPAKRVHGGLVMIRVLVGHVAASAVIDTGSERTLGNAALRDALHAGRHTDPNSFVTLVYGATSEVSSGEMSYAPVIAMGTARLAHLPVVFGSFHVFAVWGLEADPALILGMDALGTLDALAIDFEHGEFYVRTPDMSKEGIAFGHFPTH